MEEIKRATCLQKCLETTHILATAASVLITLMIEELLHAVYKDSSVVGARPCPSLDGGGDGHTHLVPPDWRALLSVQVLLEG